MNRLYRRPNFPLTHLCVTLQLLLFCLFCLDFPGLCWGLK
eukprot:06835.XXX_232020_231783_1 [CDS] Oithona nana genome sequencing.